jgi:hypothetical protein
VDLPAIVNANGDKIGKYDSDDDNSIIAVADIPQAAAPQNLPIKIAKNDDAEGDVIEEENMEDDDDCIDDDDDDPVDDKDPNVDFGGDEEKEEEEPKSGAPGVRRSKRTNKGTMRQFLVYGLMMAARQREHGGKCRAIIRDGFMFFSAKDLSDAAPIPVEDREEFALGVALTQYSIGAGIKKNQERGESEVSKELTQMHDMHVFHPC